MFHSVSAACIGLFLWHLIYLSFNGIDNHITPNDNNKEVSYLDFSLANTF